MYTHYLILHIVEMCFSQNHIKGLEKLFSNDYKIDFFETNKIHRILPKKQLNNDFDGLD